MPRLLFVSTVSLTLRSFLLPFARYFRERGWRVDGMAQGVSNCSDCISSFDRVWDISWSRNVFDLWNQFSAISRIQQVVQQEKYDLVHVHTPVAGFVTRYALRNVRTNMGARVIYTAHGFHFHPAGGRVKNFVFLAAEKLASRWTDLLVIINRTDEASALRHRLLPDDRIRYIPGIGLDTSFYSADQVSDESIGCLRRELGLSSSTPLFVMVAEFTRNKRHRDAVRALARLSSNEPHLAMAGTGPLVQDTKHLVSDLGLTSRVHFLGYRKDIPSLIRAGTALLLVSEREGLPRSVLESLSLGRPVIGTNIRGIRDLLCDDAGMLVEVGDIAGLASTMAWVLEHPDESQAMGRLGRQQVITYSLESVLKLHEEMYRSQLMRKLCLPFFSVL